MVAIFVSATMCRQEYGMGIYRTPFQDNVVYYANSSTNTNHGITSFVSISVLSNTELRYLSPGAPFTNMVWL